MTNTDGQAEHGGVLCARKEIVVAQKVQLCRKEKGQFYALHVKGNGRFRTRILIMGPERLRGKGIRASNLAFGYIFLTITFCISNTDYI